MDQLFWAVTHATAAGGPVTHWLFSGALLVPAAPVLLLAKATFLAVHLLFKCARSLLRTFPEVPEMLASMEILHVLHAPFRDRTNI